MFDIAGSFASPQGATLFKQDIVQHIGTTRACRQKNLTNAIEILPETFAQYLLTGKVRFNHFPAVFIGEDNYEYRAGDNLKYINHTVDSYAIFLEKTYQELIQASKGMLFTL